MLKYIKKYKIVSLIFWFSFLIGTLLCYFRRRSSLRSSLATFVVNGLPFILSSVTSVAPAPYPCLLSH